MNPIDMSFNILHVKLPYFVVPWHFHPEVEIMYVIKGEGTRFVGDNIENFSAGDFVIVGSNTPHVWRNNEKHYKNKDLNAECLVLFFKEETFGEYFLSIPEMSNIKRMLVDAKRGIKFSDKNSSKLKELMIRASKEKGINRMLIILGLLQEMTNYQNSDLLCSIGYNPDIKYEDYDRLNKCIEYIMVNFEKKIKLKEVADVVCMTPNSFCRYFKKRTAKTFSRFLTELRIGKACQLLIDTDEKIIEIAFESGFNSLSNFNDQFLKVKKIGPREYRSRNHINDNLNQIDESYVHLAAPEKKSYT
ncbi:AraC family transcriptional regulator [Flavobacteriaceae bacterium F89]|uniref:AraC family transcriptional regulator n=1 Tax=Cerina litoralis TaxID=2874477 RepID=A0AAE3EWH2_9FLAO|nr:AraC family transcriptional regulator [Cerina litoralis]MCG2462357.1 AraC family transcriptional regulator [Cerina litoralis]